MTRPTINMLFRIILLYAASTLIAYAQSADKQAEAEAECAKLATEKSGYNPASSGSSDSSVAKGAAIGAAGGAAVGAITAKNNSGKKAIKGGVLGAAAGAGIAAIVDSKKNKDTQKAKIVYEGEYQNCMKEKGFSTDK